MTHADLQAALARGELGDARALAIAAWRAAPSIELGDLVDAIDARIPHAPFTIKLTQPFLAAARAADDDEARGQILRAVIGRDLYDTVEMLRIALAWNDPRWGRAALTLLETLPWIGTKTRKGWRELFAMLRAHGDPRFAEANERLPPTWKIGAEQQRFMTNQLAEAVAGIAAVRSPAAATLALPRQLQSVDEATLLAAVYDQPDDDAPRAVLADWFQQQGDPRGELIALQLQGGDAVQSRVNALVRAHRAALLGPLATVVSDVTFRRGFPHAVVARFRTERDVALHGHHRAWCTVEEIGWSDVQPAADQRPWTCVLTPAMMNVRLATNPSIASLLDAERPWRIERLMLETLDADEFRAIVGSPLLPALSALFLKTRAFEPWWLERLTRVPALLALRTTFAAPERDDVIAAAERAGVETLVFGGFFSIHLARDSAGRLARATTLLGGVEALEPVPALVVNFDEWLRRLRLANPLPRPLASLEVQVDHAGKRLDVTHLLTQRRHFVL